MLPVRKSRSAQARSPISPPVVAKTLCSRSPSIDLTGYRHSSSITPTTCSPIPTSPQRMHRACLLSNPARSSAQGRSRFCGIDQPTAGSTTLSDRRAAMYDLIIRGGQVVTPEGVGNWNIAIAGEKIVLVGEAGAQAQAGRIIDATGKIVVPGGIEPHTHLNMTMAMEAGHVVRTMGPEADTIGMVFGGTTTHLDFCFVNPSVDISAALARRVEQWKGRSLVDYSFHVALTGALPLATFDQLGDAIADGFPTFKVFTTDILPSDPGRRHSLRLDHGRIHWAMQKLTRHGGLMTVHAEDDELVQFNYERFIKEGRVAGIHMAQVHTNLSEQLSFNRVIQLASATGAGVYFVHVSAREGAQAVAAARAQGLPVYAETLHQYACFNAEDYKAPRGFCYHTYPSLKFPEDQKALWDGLVDGGISAAA